MTANEVGGLTSALAKAHLEDASPAKQALVAPEASHDRQGVAGADKEGKDGVVSGEGSVDGQDLGSVHHTPSTLSVPSIDGPSMNSAIPLRIQHTLSGDSPSGETNRGDVFYDPAQSHTLGESLAVDGDASGVPVSLAATGPLSASDPRTQLYVSNLPYRVRWQDLKDLFRRAGTVLRADVSLTLDNRSRGVGTVLLATEDDARRACDMFKGFNWQGRTLDVRIDRSGTLLGVGAAQLGTPHPSNHGVAAPNTPLSPSTALLAGVSPVPSPASQHALGTSPFGMARSASQSGGSVHGRMSPAPSLGSPRVAAATPLSVANARQLGQAERSQLSSSLGLSPASKDARNLATNGISPALLPFLGASTRASISSPHMSGNSSPSLWNQSSTPSSLLQQRSASLSAGTPVYSPSLSANSPFSTHQTAFSPAGASVSSHFGQRHLPLGQTALGSSPSLTGQRGVGLGSFPGMGAGAGTSFQPQVQAQQSFLLGNTTLPQAPTMVVAPQQATAYYGRVLFVGNLPFHCQWQDLKDLFRAAGNIQRADVALTPEGKSRGFGTVLFATPEDAQNAVRIYHGYEYSGRTLKVHFDRFAQMTIPPSGTLPASPSQYTGAFAAANTPTPVANAGSATAQSGAGSFASTPSHPQPQQHHDPHQLHAFQQQNAQQYMQHQQRQNQLFYPQQHSAPHSNVFMHGTANDPSSLANPFRINDGMTSNFYAQHQQKQQQQPLHQHRNHLPAQHYQQPNFQSYQQLSQQPFSSSSSLFAQYQNPFAGTLSMPLRSAQQPFDPSAALDADATQSSDGLGTPSKASHPTAEEDQGATDGDAKKKGEVAGDDPTEAQAETRDAATSDEAPADGEGHEDQAKEDASSTPPAPAASTAVSASAPPASTAAHPGRIQLPPQNFVAPQMTPFSPINSRMTVPMTPGMPGFTFHAIPETPPVPLHFLSPGLGGPFSPPLASPTFNGPATPGAPAARSFGSVINPAPGAPIHFANGGSTPLANVMNIPSGFNPMFPPIGAAYPAPFSYSQPQQQQTHLPQTPHWTQPRQPSSSFRQHGHAIQQMTDGHPQEGNLSGGQSSASAVGDPKGHPGDGSGAGPGESGQSLGLHDIQASTGASNTEELARKIAQMSAEKALRQQQQRASDASPYDVSPSVDAAPVPSFRRASEAGLEKMEDGAKEKSARARESSEGSLAHTAAGLDAPLELRLERKSSPSKATGATPDGEPNGHSTAESS